MGWVLIIALPGAITMQEFETNTACVEAGVHAERLWAKAEPDGETLWWTCTEKG